MSEQDASASELSGQSGSGTALLQPGQEYSSHSGHDPSGAESVSNAPATDGNLLTAGTPSGHTDDTTPDPGTGLPPVPINGDDVCNTCRGASEHKSYLFTTFNFLGHLF